MFYKTYFERLTIPDKFILLPEAVHQTFELRMELSGQHQGSVQGDMPEQALQILRLVFCTGLTRTVPLDTQTILLTICRNLSAP